MLAVVAALLQAIVPVAVACSSDTQCVQDCLAALPNSTCQSCLCAAACDSSYGSCTCAGNAALRRDGVCSAAPEAPTQATCPLGPETGLEARVAFTVFSSPELQQVEVSPAFEAFLLGAVSAALGRPSSRVILKTQVFSADGDDPANIKPRNTTTALLSFEAKLNFCVLDLEQSVPDLHPRALQQSLRAYLEQFRAFAFSSMYVIWLERRMPAALLVSTTTSTLPTLAVVPEVEPTGNEQVTLLMALWIGLLVAIVLLSAVAIRWRLKRRQEEQVFDALELLEAAAAAEPKRFVEGGLVTALEAFDPGQWQSAASGPSELLTLEVGDVLQVVAIDDDWLCGHLVGLPENIGYFPASHVMANDDVVVEASSEGESDQANVQSQRQYAVATAIHAFDPDSEVEDDVFAGNCLKLALGDVLLVSARGSGWLLGEIVGSGQAGLFPESCVSFQDCAADGLPATDNMGEEIELRLSSAKKVEHAPGSPQVVPPLDKKAEDMYEAEDTDGVPDKPDTL